MRNREIESKIIDRLKAKIGDDRFDLWFEGENAIRCDGGSIQIVSREKFAQNRIRQSFLADLEKISTQIFGQQAPVEFRIEQADFAPRQPANPNAQSLKSGEFQDSGSPIQAGQKLAASDKRSATPPEPAKRRLSATAHQPCALDRFEFDEDNAVLEAVVRQTLKRQGNWTPLYFYGPVGCGKTHLLRGIVGACRTKQGSRCLYMTAEQFTSNFIEALDGRGVADFRRKCRGLDVLAIDDIQFFAGKRATLIEFQSTVEALVRDGKQVVLSGDCSLAELNHFDPELINRIAGGLPCTINYADRSSRIKILKRQAKDRQINIQPSIVDYLAEHLGNDIRHLSGALNRIQAAQLSGAETLAVDDVHDLVVDLIRASRKSITIREIESAVSQFCGIAPKEMRSAARNQSISTARMLAMFLSRRLTGSAFAEIGQHFGGRSHSTVISADRKINEWIERNHFISVNHTRCNVSDVVKRIETKLKLG